MRISVDHRTHYLYDEDARYVVQRLRLTPADNAMQTVHDWTITMPGIEGSVSYVDGFENLVHLVTNQGEFGVLYIRAHGTVETHDTAGIFGEDSSGRLPALYLRNTPMTEPDQSLKKFSKSIAEGDDPVDFLHSVMNTLHKTVEFDTDSTHSGTSAREAFAMGRGVCQDHTHIFLSIARAHNIPARYVTGYLHVGTIEEPEVAHHAWAEAYVPDLGWVGFDPVNCISPNEHYIRLACGLDAAYAAPVVGVRRGGGGEVLDVAVEVRQMQQ